MTKTQLHVECMNISAKILKNLVENPRGDFKLSSFLSNELENLLMKKFNITLNLLEENEEIV